METKTRLIMSFKTDGDRQVSISIDDPKDDITEEEIKGFMEVAISKNVFAPNGEELVALVDAKVVTTDTQEYDLAI